MRSSQSTVEVGGTDAAMGDCDCGGACKAGAVEGGQPSCTAQPTTAVARQCDDCDGECENCKTADWASTLNWGRLQADARPGLDAFWRVATINGVFADVTGESLPMGVAVAASGLGTEDTVDTLRMSAAHLEEFARPDAQPDHNRGKVRRWEFEASRQLLRAPMPASLAWCEPSILDSDLTDALETIRTRHVAGNLARGVMPIGVAADTDRLVEDNGCYNSEGGCRNYGCKGTCEFDSTKGFCECKTPPVTGPKGHLPGGTATPESPLSEAQPPVIICEGEGWGTAMAFMSPKQMQRAGGELEAAKEFRRSAARTTACAIARGVCLLTADECCIEELGTCMLDPKSGCPTTVTYENEESGKKMYCDLKDHIHVALDHYYLTTKPLDPQKNRYSGRHYYGAGNDASEAAQAEKEAITQMQDILAAFHTMETYTFQKGWIYICECTARDSSVCV